MSSRQYIFETPLFTFILSACVLSLAGVVLVVAPARPRAESPFSNIHTTHASGEISPRVTRAKPQYYSPPTVYTYLSFHIIRFRTECIDCREARGETEKGSKLSERESALTELALSVT